MSLSVSMLYDTCVKQFATSAGSARFSSDFVDAFNNVLDDLWGSGGLDSEIDHIEAQDTQLVGLESRHTSILLIGLVYHLEKLGQKHSGIDLEQAQSDWEAAQGRFVEMEQRAWQADVDSDGDSNQDVIGLGRTKS